MQLNRLGWSSPTIAKHGQRELIKGNRLVPWSFVLNHVSLDALLLRLRESLILHVVAEEVVQARDLVNEGEVVIIERLLVCPSLLPLKALEDGRTLLIHVNNQVLQLLLMYLKVFHHQVMRQPIPLIKVLPVVVHVVGVAVSDAVDVQTIEIGRDKEHQREAGTRVNVSSDVLIVESDVYPSSRSSQPRSHFLLNLTLYLLTNYNL